MNDEHPCQSPSAEAEPTADTIRDGRMDVRSIAIEQKVVLACVVFYPLTLLGIVLGMHLSHPVLQVLFLVGMCVVGLVSWVYLFSLATKVYGMWIGILLFLLCIVGFDPAPLVGIRALLASLASLFALLLINGKATRILRQNGYHVGLFGANLSKFKR